MYDDHYLFNIIDFEKCLFSLYGKKEIIFTNDVELNLCIPYFNKTKELVATLYLKQGKIIDIIFSEIFKKSNGLLKEKLSLSLQKNVDYIIGDIKNYFLNIIIDKVKDKIKTIETGECLYKSDKNPKKLEYLKQLLLTLNDYKYCIQYNKFITLSKSNFNITDIVNDSEIDFIEFIEYNNKEYLEEIINSIIDCYMNCSDSYNEEQLKLVYSKLCINLKCYFINVFLLEIIRYNKDLDIIDNVVADFQDVIKFNGLNIIQSLIINHNNLKNISIIENIYKKFKYVKVIIENKIFDFQDLFIYFFFKEKLVSNYAISDIFKLIKYTDIQNQENFFKIISGFNANNIRHFISDFIQNLFIYYIKNPNRENRNFVNKICEYCFYNGIFLEYNNQKIKAKDFLIYTIINSIYMGANFEINIFKLLDNIVINDEEIENIVINSLFIYNSYDIFYNFIIYLLENNLTESKNYIRSIYKKTDGIFFNFCKSEQIKVSHYILNVVLNFAVINRESNICDLLRNINIKDDDIVEMINFNKNNDILYLKNFDKSCIFTNLVRLINTQENNDFVKSVIRKINDIEILNKFKSYTEKDKIFYNMINYKLQELDSIKKLKDITFAVNNIEDINFEELYNKNPDCFMDNFFGIVNAQNLQQNKYNGFCDIIIKLENFIDNQDVFLKNFKHNENFSIFYINKKLEKENIFIKRENSNYFIINKNNNNIIKINNNNTNIVDYIINEKGFSDSETKLLKLINDKTGIKSALIRNYEKHILFGFHYK